MAEDAFLSREDALLLLDEFRELLTRLEAGELEEETTRDAERLVNDLSRLPLPPEVLEDHVKEMGIWTDLLLEARSEEREDRGIPLATRLENRVLRLQGMVEEGVEP